MKTKPLLLFALAGAMAWPAAAQPGRIDDPPNPFSYTVVVPPGWSLIANQLDFRQDGENSNKLANVLPSVPNGAELLKYDAVTHDFIKNKFRRGQWSNPGQTLDAWEGAFFYNPTRHSLALTFHGRQRNRDSVRLPKGLSLMSCPTLASSPAFFGWLPIPPDPGPTPVLTSSPPTLRPVLIEGNGADQPEIPDQPFFNPQEGDTIYTFNPGRGSFVAHTFRHGHWDIKPTLKIGEAFFVRLRQPRTLSFYYPLPV